MVEKRSTRGKGHLPPAGVTLDSSPERIRWLFCLPHPVVTVESLALRGKHACLLSPRRLFPSTLAPSLWKRLPQECEHKSPCAVHTSSVHHLEGGWCLSSLILAQVIGCHSWQSLLQRQVQGRAQDFLEPTLCHIPIL